jgi:hypothetical protein
MKNSTEIKNMQENRYLITWQIDSWGENPLDALKRAIEKMPHPMTSEDYEGSIATVFDVKCVQEGAIDNGVTYQIDALEEGCNPFNENNVENFKGEFAIEHVTDNGI